MKPFVGCARRLGDEAFGLSLRECGCDLLSVYPALVPVDQQAASCVRVHLDCGQTHSRRFGYQN
jgi:hypothetical protein